MSRPPPALLELTVNELALVESARVSFGPGLNLLTGETGSGKSLIVDALGLALGDRATLGQVRQGAARARVEAVFAGAGGRTVLGRELGRRSAAWLDGEPATPARLRERGARLVAIHGQHEHQRLLEPEAQTELLDAFAGAGEQALATAVAHAGWTAAADRLADLRRTQARGHAEQEYLRWQLAELRGAALREGEDTELAAERAAARHATKLAELVGRALVALRAEEGVPEAAASIAAGGDLDPRLGPHAERLALMAEELADIAGDLRDYSEALDSDPARLEAIEGRLAQLEQVKRKYGGSIEAAIAEAVRLEARLGGGEDLDTALVAAEAAERQARARLEAEAAALTALRRTSAVELAAAVASELEGLRLEGASFAIELESRAEIGPGGAELAEMMFSANPGERPAALARVASGGELSRVMLALRTVLAAADSVPVLVFDEVDAGIGGEAATQVGIRLKRLGRHHQVLVVTHLAQIACMADRHLLVEKVSGGEGRNVVAVRALESRPERAAELARMMSGKVTEKALARAEELIEEADRVAARAESAGGHRRGAA